MAAMSKLSSFFALLAVTLAAAFLFFQLLAVFLLPLFLAVVLVVLLQPVYQRLLRLLNGRNHLAAAAMTFAVLLTALNPAASVTARRAKNERSCDRAATQPVPALGKQRTDSSCADR
ncbi:MAG: hypothetical protein ACK5YE_14830, partial [Planctomyces sp.]